MKSEKLSKYCHRYTGLYTFPSPTILRVEGRDAPRYLNARLTYDIKSLSPEQACLAAQLEPKGRTEGVFLVVRPPSETNTFFLISTGGDSEEIVAAFRRYLVADRVTVSNCSDEYTFQHLCLGEHDWTPSTTSEENSGTAQLVHLNSEFSTHWYQQSCIISHRRLTHPGFDLFFPKENASHFREMIGMCAELDREIRKEDFELGRFLSGYPTYPNEISPKRIFLESGLFAALSSNKGCYTGQEVIERADALGRLPRRLLRTESEISNWSGSVPKSVTLPEGEILGEVLSWLYDSNLQLLLTFVSVKSSVSAPAEVHVDSLPARLLPLRYIPNK